MTKRHSFLLAALISLFTLAAPAPGFAKVRGDLDFFRTAAHGERCTEEAGGRVCVYADLNISNVNESLERYIVCYSEATWTFNPDGTQQSVVFEDGCAFVPRSMMPYDSKHLRTLHLYPTTLTLSGGAASREVTIEADFKGAGVLTTSKSSTKERTGNCTNVTKTTDKLRPAETSFTVSGQSYTSYEAELRLQKVRFTSHCK